MARVFSGIQPTGDKHLGNLLGAISTWVAAQHEHECLFCIVDLHALTAAPEPESLWRDTRRTAALLLASGLDPARCTIFVQSHVPAHTGLGWILACITAVGELRRMTQFKAKSAEVGGSVGLFTYPVLQAADILAYRAERVPVGEDQRQHLELVRDLAARFNRRYRPLFPLPEAMLPEQGRRVMDLQRPTSKMSTSGGTELGTLRLLDPPDSLRRKVRAAVTDPGREIRSGSDKPGVSNLLAILAGVTGEPVPALEERLRGRGYAALKSELAEAVVDATEPIRARYRALERGGFAAVAETLAQGAARARAIADETLAEARAAVGLLAMPRPPARHRDQRCRRGDA